MVTRMEFDGWTLLPATGELWGDGSRRRLQSQAVQVLLLLLRRPGELVAREELVEDLWPDTVVDYKAGLNAVIRKLRVALGDDAEDPRYIETIPRRGYRYVGRCRRSTRAKGCALTRRVAMRRPLRIALITCWRHRHDSANRAAVPKRYAALATLAVGVLTLVWSTWTATIRSGSVKSRWLATPARESRPREVRHIPSNLQQEILPRTTRT